VTALVHTNPEIRANDGSLVPVAGVLKGDITEKHFGLPQGDFHGQSLITDVIVHCAATVRFDLPEEDYALTNIRGVAHALDLAREGGPAFLQVSTAYVCGTRDGPIREADPLPAAGFANAYEASKRAGEMLVRESGVDWAIARPSIVVGEHESGAIRQFDTTYAAFKLIAEGRVGHMPARAGATLDFVPLDHVAAGIVAIAENMKRARGGTYHLVSGQPLPVERFTACIGAWPQFHEPELVSPEAFDPAQLPALERRLFRRVAGLYASYFQRDPHFDDSAFHALTGFRCPETGEAYIRRLIDYCIEVGFLSSPSTCDGKVAVAASD